MRALGVAFGLVVLLAPDAVADPAPITPAAELAIDSATTPTTPAPTPTLVHLKSPRRACRLANPDDCATLGPGYFLDEDSYARLDVETRRLQDTETRLKAENQSLRGTLASWQPGWITSLVILSAGFAAGIYVEHRLTN